MKLRVVTPAVVAAALLFVAAGCGSDSTATTTQVDDVTTSVAAPAADPGTAADASAPAGIVQVDPVTAANLIVNGPSELVVLDIRTPDEFVAGHIVGATDIDFYEPDFADRIAELDPPAAPYVVYCNSGNRSGESMALFEQLGFTSVTEIGGGIQAWMAAGLPVQQ